MHYLVAIWDGGGTVPAELGVVRQLVAAGHTATVLADPSVRDDVVAVGAEFRSWDRAPHRRSSALEDDLFRDWEISNPVTLLGVLRDRMITGPAAAYATDVRAALAARPADAALVSSTLLGAMVGAEAAGVPVGVLVPNCYPRPADGLPPFGLGLAQGRTPLGRLRDRLLSALPARLWAKGLPALNAARGEHGLSPLSEVWEQWDRAARVLVLTSPAFDYEAERLPGNVVYTGPVLDDPAWATDDVALPPGDAPLVVVGLSSTYMQQADLLRRIVAALDDLPVRALVTTGQSVDPAEVPGTARVRVVRSAPHSRLFGEAAVVVTHAGHGTLLKALAAGVPAVCVPMGRDQGDNVTRAARHGAVVRLKPTASVPAVRDAVRAVLDDPRYRERARALGARLREDADSGALLREVEAVARNGATVRA